METILSCIIVFILTTTMYYFYCIHIKKIYYWKGRSEGWRECERMATERAKEKGKKMTREYCCKKCGYSLLLTEELVNLEPVCPICNTKFEAGARIQTKKQKIAVYSNMLGTEFIYIDHTKELAHVVRIDEKEDLSYIDYTFANQRHVDAFKKYINSIWDFHILEEHTKDNILQILKGCLDTER